MSKPLSPPGPIYIAQGADFLYTLRRLANACQITVHAVGGSTGDFTPNFQGVDSAAIDIGASASAVQAVLMANRRIGGGSVAVTGPDGGPWLVAWAGRLSRKPQPLLTVAWNLSDPAGNVEVGAVPLDLTPFSGYHAVLRDKPGGGTPYADITDTENADGEILLPNMTVGEVTLWIKAAKTATYTWSGFAQLDLEVTDPDGYVEAWLTAQAALARSVIPP